MDDLESTLWCNVCECVCMFHIVCSLRETQIVPVLVLHHASWRCQQHNWFVLCCTASASRWPDMLLFFCIHLLSLVFSLSLCFFLLLSIPVVLSFVVYISLSWSLEILSLLWELTWIALPPGLPQAPFIMMLQFNVKFILLFAVALPHSLCLYSTFGFSLRNPVDSVTITGFLVFPLVRAICPGLTQIQCKSCVWVWVGNVNLYG